MAGFVITKKLTRKEALDAIHGLTRWFLDHPRRKVCQTDLGWKVRRDHVIEDVAKHTQA